MATVVALHAHPDDEIILTGGTLAKLAHTGHRTVIVVASDGQFDGAVAPRLRELQASARVRIQDRTVSAVRVAEVFDPGHAENFGPDEQCSSGRTSMRPLNAWHRSSWKNARMCC
ncbi:PIG-L deacetylase family protein [Nocardia sp. NBC_00403]|uniref:PIG-L deacetylase family protein n=1 Tax=Nocardia sp. NBC_00403 TaxID=2975990 RepID=UPI002E1BB0E0